MRKLLCIIALFLNLASADNTEDSQWKSFFGVEAGVGIFGVGAGWIFTANSLFNTAHDTLGLGYSGGILGGWQKYTYEKVGIRNTLGFAFSYTPNISSIKKGQSYHEFCIIFCKNTKEYIYNNRTAQHYDFYYALDGLFDFVKSGESRFGMSFGFSLNLSFADSQGINDYIGGATAFFGARTGLYTQFDNNVLEFILKIPILGFGKDSINVSALTLNYKHLF